MQTTKTARLFTAEGYLTLGDVRAFVKNNYAAPDDALIESGMDEGKVERFDVIRVEWSEPTELDPNA